ncbi:NAD(P)/FAD-dependent oxidoreductase [Streptomyces celluloflavus]|uniref:NAD(P)/FAD-dependent oxidoreductase n=1 Tax=Streptomyces celluloflavus TaxID=58344 RepID=UPI0036C4EECC
MRARIAVVGTGGAGLSAAYHLRDIADVTLFDKDTRAGGHAHTVEVEDSDTAIGVDTGFVVYNRTTYPQLAEFFTELGVETARHDGGFDFFDLDTGLSFGTPELPLTESQIAERYPADFLDVWRQARRFYRQAPRDCVRGLTHMTLREYLRSNGYTEEFLRSYVILLGTAVWSVPAGVVLNMPASCFIVFFTSHGRGGLGGDAVEWRNVVGGSVSYVRRVVDAVGGALRLGEEVTGVHEVDDRVAVTTRSGVDTFDYVVMATHADQAVRVLDPRHPARPLLTRVRYSRARAVLHRDPSVLPGGRERWQSWNYGRSKAGGRDVTHLVYYMNRIQGFQARHDYFVSIGGPRPPREETVVKEIDYTHPVVTRDVLDLQSVIHTVNTGSRIKFCGSYFHSRRMGPDQIGAHEGAFCSGLDAARAVRAALRGEYVTTPV